MKRKTETLGELRCTVLVAFLSHDDMIVIEPYADRVDIEQQRNDLYRQNRKLIAFIKERRWKDG